MTSRATFHYLKLMSSFALLGTVVVGLFGHHGGGLPAITGACLGLMLGAWMLRDEARLVMVKAETRSKPGRSS